MARNLQEQQQSIQTLFLQPAESYTLAGGARLLGITPAALKREAAFDIHEEYRREGKWCFSWKQLANIALQTRWTLEEVVDALGADAATALPPLLALRTVTVRLPAFIVCALETAASEDHKTVSAYLTSELLEFAGTVVDRMEAKVPGVRAAYHFPTPCPRTQNRRDR